MVVTVNSGSACSGCHAKEVCLATESEEKEIQISCEEHGFLPGQFITVTMKESLGAKALLYGYILPLLLVIFILFVIFTLTSDEALSALIAIGVLVPYYAGLYFFRDSFKKTFRFELEKID